MACALQEHGQSCHGRARTELSAGLACTSTRMRLMGPRAVAAPQLARQTAALPTHAERA